MSKKVVVPGQMIGIIGGGQLGRMMALSAKAMGYRIAVLDPAADSPCGQVADIKIIASYSDIEGISELADVSDVITYEFENIDSSALKWLCEHAWVPQGTDLLEITQNRVKEKMAIEAAGGQVVPYAVIDSIHDIQVNIERLGLPVVLKTVCGGYDGKGQVVIRDKQEIESASTLLEQGQCILEKWIPFKKEISVIIARNLRGETVELPVAENIHHENILHQTIVPARISKTAEEVAIHYATRLADKLGMIGTLAVEMFLTEEDTIYINELAPRPHNSGHYSIEACETSQFAQHIRALCNLPLGKTELLKPAVMVNILGEHQQKVLDKLPESANWKVHFYGKKDPKVKRKMGHITILTESIEATIEEVKRSCIWEVNTLEAKR